MSAVGLDQLTGQDDGHLCQLVAPGRCLRLTPATADAYGALAQAAREQGFELAIASAHRDFERQLAIWNAKAAGERPVLDDRGLAVDIGQLDDREQVLAILRWSALPGMSRHHWGCDLDIYDAAAVTPDYRVQLAPAECSGEGVFAPLHRWLDQRIAQGRSFDFYRPYDVDRGGVAPEPWHLSYAPQARQFEQHMDRQRCYDFLRRQPIALCQAVLDNFDEIYGRFIACGPTGDSRPAGA